MLFPVRSIMLKEREIKSHPPLKPLITHISILLEPFLIPPFFVSGLKDRVEKVCKKRNIEIAPR